MIELIKLLKVKSDEHAFINYNSILFTSTNFSIFLEFQVISEDEADDLQDWFMDNDIDHYNINIEELERPLFSKLSISSLSITDYEYLGYRADIKYSKQIKSISNRLYLTILQISSLDKDAIKEYNLDVNDGYDGNGYMCNAEPNFIFNIYIKEEYYTNLTFFESLLMLPRIEETSPPYFYTFFYEKNEKIGDSGKVNILNTNTKSRRLGYLKLLAKYLQENQKVPTSKLNSRFENYAINYSDFLDYYKNSKGLIQKTKAGNSAQPYITLACDMGWVAIINNIAIASKQMKVYLELSQELNKANGNPFELTTLDKLFFFELILDRDFLYISTILELLYTSAANSYGELVLKFQNFVLYRLNEYNERFKFFADSKKIKPYKIIQERIQKWTEPKTYLEHVLMPRINWLLDLGLIILHKDLTIELTQAGNRLFEHFCYWNDINSERIINPKEHLKLFAVHVFDSIYEQKEISNEVSKEKIKNLLNEYIDESFLYFKTLAPNRVTASQAISYAKYKIYLNNNIKVGSKYIENYLKNEATSTYVYKYQKQYDDGYIQKILKK